MASTHGKARWIQALGTSIPHISLTRHPLSKSWYIRAFLFLFSMSFILSLADLLSTSYALSIGLAEANGVVVAIGQFTGWGILGALTAVKVLFLAGAGFACMLGAYTKVPRLRKEAFVLLLALVCLLLAVTLNNLYWIFTSM